MPSKSLNNKWYLSSIFLEFIINLAGIRVIIYCTVQFVNKTAARLSKSRNFRLKNTYCVCFTGNDKIEEDKNQYLNDFFEGIKKNSVL